MINGRSMGIDSIEKENIVKLVGWGDRGPPTQIIKDMGIGLTETCTIQWC